MSYTLINKKTAANYSCEDTYWLEILDLARQAGWEGEGTTIDFERELNTVWDEKQDYLYNLLLMIRIHMQRVDWNRNYIDKVNQLVSDSDAYNLHYYLAGKGIDPSFMGFIECGSFYICG